MPNQSRKNYDNKHNTPLYNVGDSVLLKNCRRETRKGGKLEVRWTGPYTIEQLGEKGTVRLSGLKRKVNLGHIKQYVKRKREVSEFDNDEKDGRNEQGGAPVKRQRSEVSETQTSSTTKSAHKVRDLEVTEVKEAALVNFKPVCTEWQQEMCGRFNFNLTLKRKSRYSHLNPPSPISIDHEPQKTIRIRGDGNCFFRTVSHIVSGDQEGHTSVRIAIVRYLRQNPQVFLSVLPDSQTMDQYLLQSKMETPRSWATEVEIFATATLLNTPIWIFAPYGKNLRWMKYAPLLDNVSVHQGKLCLW